MKKTAITLAMLAWYVPVTQAAPSDDTWYTGAKLGWSRYHDTGFTSFDGSQIQIGDGPTRRDQLGVSAFLGYQLNQYLGVETGYDWLGRIAYKGDTNNGAFKAHGVQLSARLSYPIMQTMDIYTRLGGMAWRADGTANLNNTTRISGHKTGFSPLIAMGLEYAFTDSLATRMEYQWISNIGEANGSTGARPDNGLLSVGIVYRFGQNAQNAQNAQNSVLPKAAAVIPAATETKQFTLNADVLFNFAKSTLKPEGQKVLDGLYPQLSVPELKEAAIAIVGHTDRMGTSAYNQKLSEKRARSVADYLISKGVSAHKLSVSGVGSSSPATGTACNDKVKRQQRIQCLAPDRRVEISINESGQPPLK